MGEATVCFGRNFGPCIITIIFIPCITSFFLCCNSSFFIPCITSFFLCCISSFFIPCITSFFLCWTYRFFICWTYRFFICCTYRSHHNCTTSYNKQCINHLCFILSFAGTSSPQTLILQFSVFIDFNIVCMFEYSYTSLYDKTK